MTGKKTKKKKDNHKVRPRHAKPNMILFAVGVDKVSPTQKEECVLANLGYLLHVEHNNFQI